MFDLYPNLPDKFDLDISKMVIPRKRAGRRSGILENGANSFANNEKSSIWE